MGHWLLATLGGQPQLVTVTLDLLLARGEEIDEVITIFPGANERYIQAHRRLVEEFDRYQPYIERRIRYRPLALSRLSGRPLMDIQNSADVDLAWQAISQLVATAKGAGTRLHISLSGGRRALALMLFSVAMLYCTPNDRIWHIYTPREVLKEIGGGRRLHVEEGAGVRLLEIPFAPWGAYFPGVKSILGLRPRQILALRAQWPDEETARRCTQVWQRLSPRQREVLRALVEQPTRAAAAEVLGVSLSTVDTHREAILSVCRLVWLEEKVDLRFMRRVFGGWMRGRPEER